MTRIVAQTRALTPKQKVPEVKIVVSHDHISQVAYAIWERRGRPQGQSLQHWLAAEAELAKMPAATPQVEASKA